MPENSPVNLFLLLDLDPDKAWNQVEFDRRLEEKRQEWSRLSLSPSAKGKDAKVKLGYYLEIKTIGADDALRKVQAEDAKKNKNQQQIEKIKALEEELKFLESKEFLWQAEFDELLKKYSPPFSEASIKNKIKVPLKKMETSGGESKKRLDSSKAKSIESLLKSINKKSLYDFLGLSERTENKILVDEANRLYKVITEKGTKTAIDSIHQQLIGECQAIFKNTESRQPYDETFRLSQYDEIKQQMDLASKVSKRIEVLQVEKVMRDARQKGLDTDETIQIMSEYAGQKKIAIFFPQGMHKLQLCGYCDELTDSENANCSHCGKPLTEPCPRCEKKIKTMDMACGGCGFPGGNRNYVSILIGDAEITSKSRNFEGAIEILERASQAWPAAGKDSLSKSVLELLEKARLGLRKQNDQHGLVKAAIKDKKFYLAMELLNQLSDILPKNSPIVVGHRTTVDQKIKEAEEALKIAQVMQKTDPEKAIESLLRLLANCSDCEAARKLLSLIPPTPPSELKIALEGNIARLSWKAGSSKGVRYTIIRAEHVRPSSIASGKVLGTIPGLDFDDQNLEAGIPYFYAVYTNREETYSFTAALSTRPIFLAKSVDSLVASIADGQVQLNWSAPTHVEKISVYRSSDTYPLAEGKGLSIQVFGNKSAIDNLVENEKTYFYSVFCIYRDTLGADTITSPAAHIQARPQVPPAPIKELRITVSGASNNRKISIEFDPPDRGDVVILKTREPINIEMGTVQRVSKLQSGEHIKTNKGKATDEGLRLGLYYYTPILIIGDNAYFGKETLFANIDDVDHLDGKYYGNLIRLTWTWPEDCNGVLIVYGNKSWPIPNNAESSTIHLVKSQYEIHGYFDIPAPAKQDCYIKVLATIEQGDNKFVASGDQPGARKLISVQSRKTLEYSISKQSFFSKRSLKINISEGIGPLPALCLVRKLNTLPNSKNEGDVILRIPAGAEKQKSYSIELPKSAEMAKGYAKLFLEDVSYVSSVVINHPEKKNLELF